MGKYLNLFLVVVIIFASCLGENAPVPSFQEQLKKDVALVDSYLRTNAINAVKDSSGVRYLISTIGTGQILNATSVVYVGYKGKLIPGGQLFIDSKDAFTKVLLDAPSLISCWQIVLPKLTKGSAVTIYSPSGLAFGSSSFTDGKLPPNSNVIFDLKLLDEVAQFTSDTTSIKTYLTTNNISATTHPSGVRYVITFTGNGAKPTAANSVTFNYNGKLLSTGVSFDKSTSPINTPLSNIIKGLQIGFQLLPVGSKATFYIPSSLGYGPEGTQNNIPGNANLIFEIELVGVN